MTPLKVCVLVLACTGGTAAAQHARYPLQQPAPSEPVLSDRVKPLVPKPPDPAAAKPTITADDVLSIETLRSTVRGEQEQILAKLIDNTPDSEVEEKSDYYFRLAELYAKQQRVFRLQAAEATIQVGNAKTTQAKAQAQANAKKAEDAAKMYLLKAVKTYKGLTDNDAFRNYPKLDMALFFYGYTLQSGKYMKEARAVYDKLLKNFPNSKYVPEAHLVFGDYYFDAGQLADAEARYKQVAKYPHSTVYAYALYKLGWIHLQLQRAQDAAESFRQVMLVTRNDKQQAALYQAANTDFARVSGGSEKTDKTASIDLVEVTADAARDTGATDRAASAYRDLLQRARGDARACRWQYRLAHVTLTMPGATAVAKVKEIEALVRLNSSLKQPNDECRANAATMAREIAAAFYWEFSKTAAPTTLVYAEKLMGLYVGAFPDATEDERATYAEMLWRHADLDSNADSRSELWKRAAEAFSTVKTQDAARAAALAWMNALDVVVPADAKVSISKHRGGRPQKLAGRDAKLIAAVAAYIAQAPDPDDDLAQMRLAAAMVLRKNRHFDEAATMLDQFLEHHPDHARAELAANLMLDSMVQAGQLDELEQVAAAMAADRDFVDGKPELLRNLALLSTRR